MARSKSKVQAKNSNHATVQEVLDAYEIMTPAEMKRVRAAACLNLKGTSFDQPSDLIHQALHRTLEGRRNWPKHIDFPIYLIKTMQSIVSAERARMENSSKNVDVGTAESEAHSSGDRERFHSPSAEDVACANEERDFARRIVRAAEIILEATDARAFAVLGAMLQELAPSEISASMGMDLADYYAAKKRVLRRLAASATL